MEQALERAAKIEQVVETAKKGFRELRKRSLEDCIVLLMQHAVASADQEAKEFKRIKYPKLNRWTGKPRAWRFPGHRFADDLVEVAEVLRAYKNSGRNYREANAAIPVEIVRDLVDTLGNICYHLDKCLPPELTEAQRKYCESEAIPEADFLARLAK
jgi:hypothetical protein